MAKTKLCPVKTKDGISRECMEGGCAWWIPAKYSMPDIGLCAVAKIARCIATAVAETIEENE